MLLDRLARIALVWLVLLCFLGSAWAGSAGGLPDPKLTPGATNPAITQDNIHSTICDHEHWTTKNIRPPSNYTNKR